MRPNRRRHRQGTENGRRSRLGMVESSDLVFEFATSDDIDEIVKIERLPESTPFVEQWSAEKHRANLSDAEFLYFVARPKTGDEIIAYVILQDVTNPYKSAWFRRIAVRQRSHGVGTAFVRHVCKHVFETLGFHRIWLNVSDDNAVARALYARLGFREEGIARESILHANGEYGSYILMGLLEGDWRDGDG